jgi:hypothetical protein
MQFIFAPSNNTNIYVDGVLWNRNQDADRSATLNFATIRPGRVCGGSKGKAWDTLLKMSMTLRRSIH